MGFSLLPYFSTEPQDNHLPVSSLVFLPPPPPRYFMPADKSLQCIILTCTRSHSLPFSDYNLPEWPVPERSCSTLLAFIMGRINVSDGPLFICAILLLQQFTDVRIGLGTICFPFSHLYFLMSSYFIGFSPPHSLS